MVSGAWTSIVADEMAVLATGTFGCRGSGHGCAAGRRPHGSATIRPARRAHRCELRRAAHEVGFVYLCGHGVDPNLDETMFRTARGADHGATDAPRHRALPRLRGHTILGDEVTNGRSDWRDQLDLGQSSRTGMVQMTLRMRLLGPNQCPPLPTMAPTVLHWMAAMDDVGILNALAVGLGLIDHFDHGFLPESDVHLECPLLVDHDAGDGKVSIALGYRTPDLHSSSEVGGLRSRSAGR